MRTLTVPLELSELLHATLGPLADVLEAERHPWHPLLAGVLADYEDALAGRLTLEHGPGVLEQVKATTAAMTGLLLARVDLQA